MTMADRPKSCPRCGVTRQRRATSLLCRDCKAGMSAAEIAYWVHGVELSHRKELAA